MSTKEVSFSDFREMLLRRVGRVFKLQVRREHQLVEEGNAVVRKTPDPDCVLLDTRLSLVSEIGARPVRQRTSTRKKEMRLPEHGSKCHVYTEGEKPHFAGARLTRSDSRGLVEIYLTPIRRGK